MRRKEDFTRRDAGTVIAGAAAALVGTYFAARVPNILNRSRYSGGNSERSREQDPVLFVSRDESPFLIHSGAERFQVGVNFPAIAETLDLIALREGGEKGLHTLSSFLEHYHMHVRLKDHNPVIRAHDGRMYEPDTAYVYSRAGGPALLISRMFLERYGRATREGDKSQQAENDKRLWFELFHVWQEAGNQDMHAMQSIVQNTVQASPFLQTMTGWTLEDYPIEAEALQKSEEIVQSLRAGYISGRIQEWPFGNFFSFEKA